MAQSVLTALVENISNASVTVEILLLLQKYRTKFLELVSNTTYPSAKEETEANTARQESEKILDERIEEIKELEAVKEKLVSFVNMCDLIGPGEISLSSKEIFTICTSSLIMVLNMFSSKWSNGVHFTAYDKRHVKWHVFCRKENVLKS